MIMRCPAAVVPALALLFLVSGLQGRGNEKGGRAVKPLPEPVTKGRMSVEEAIAARRSVRSYIGKALSDETLSQLLWAAQGVTDGGRGFRSAPSAGEAT